jgi:hypothetical protein
MWRPIWTSIAMLSAIFLLAGCGDGGGSQAGKQHHAHEESRGAKLTLHPESGSGVSGNAAFEDVSKGVRVDLELRNLPESGTFYLAHIHPGTCAQGEEEEHHEHGEQREEGEGHEHMEHGDEIEYPLTQVKSGSKGEGSSTTTLGNTSLEKLFSGEPKHVNVHEAGTGDPPVLTCANLKREG